MSRFLNHPGWGVSFVMVMAVFAAWSTLRLSQADESAQLATRQLGDAQRYADEIKVHRQSPTVISDKEMGLTLLARLVEQAADSAQIDRRNLDRIWPQPARRIGDTPYQRKATQLVVRDVTLPQAITFLHQLTSGDTPLSLDALRLSAPRSTNRAPGINGSVSGGALETWTVEATVSHLLYQPPAPGQVAQRN